MTIRRLLRAGALARTVAKLTGSAAITVAVITPVAVAATITLHETGSTLLYPLFQAWVADYQQRITEVAITAAATGSGAGYQAAVSGSA